MDKVLIIDDNKQNCEIIRDLLYTWGYEVCLAFDGYEGFNLASKISPDAIILDVMLPGINGFETCKKLKENETTKNIPIVMITALNEVEDKIRGFNVGADVFLSKPIIYQELKNRILWVIESKKNLENMEQIDNVTKSFLNIIKLKDRNLYVHCENVKSYCEKVGKILFLSNEEMKQLVIGAYLHDIGKILSNNLYEHVDIGQKLVSNLNMYKWLKTMIRNHHEKINGSGFPDNLTSNEMSQNLQILITVNRFIELLEELKDSKMALSMLTKECENGEWNLDVNSAINQVLEDERFIESIKYS